MFIYIHVYIYVHISTYICVYVYVYIYIGKTGVTADRDKIEFRLFNSSSIFNITLREELFSLPKQKPTMHSCPGFMELDSGD